jgi:hypothetical protein
MRKLKHAWNLFIWAVANPRLSLFGIRSALLAKRGYDYAAGWTQRKNEMQLENQPATNRLRAFFEANTEGNGIWKFEHYFDIYDRHFRKFVGKEVHIVEVGIYSGGSLRMWKDYFGEQCKVYGVDIVNECKNYENDHTRIFIGDQESRSFWKSFRDKVPCVDILVDDGGHLTEQQIVTLEEVLPHLSPGGVYLCEDVSGERNKLVAYMGGLQNAMNHINALEPGTIRSASTGFQQQIASIHQYPYVYVIEKRELLVDELIAPKHGTVWGPFYKSEEK